MWAIGGRVTKAEFHAVKYYIDVKYVFISSPTEMSFGNVFWFPPNHVYSKIIFIRLTSSLHLKCSKNIELYMDVIPSTSKRWRCWSQPKILHLFVETSQRDERKENWRQTIKINKRNSRMGNKIQLLIILSNSSNRWSPISIFYMIGELLSGHVVHSVLAFGIRRFQVFLIKAKSFLFLL